MQKSHYRICNSRIRIVDPGPYDRHCNSRRDPWRKQNKFDDPASFKCFLHQKSQHQTKYDRRNQSSQCKHNCVPKCIVKSGILKQRNKIIKKYKIVVRSHIIPVCETNIDRSQDRINPKYDQRNECRQNKKSHTAQLPEFYFILHFFYPFLSTRKSLS